MEKDYYKILGITDEEKKLTGKAFNDVLKKKYKKLALELHPDRHVNDSEEEKKAAEEKFKEVTEANTVLSDEKTRAQYDNGGMGDMDLSDFMRHFSGGFSDFFGGFGRQQKREPSAEFHANVKVSFNESVTGCKKTVTLKEKPCHHCGGSGMVQSTKQNGNMFFSTSSPCPHCHGTGTEKSDKEQKVEFEVPAGVSNGMRMHVPVEGGALIVSFVVENDPYFVRVDDLNVVHYEEVPIKDCLLGFTRKVKTIKGTEIEIKGDECTNDGKTFFFNGLGMPDVRGRGVGDYAVVIKYIYPTKLSKEQRELISKL